MGSGLCRRAEGRPRTAEVDGFYRKMVFNYAKQWTRYSDKQPKSSKSHTKHNKRKTKKPTISGPFPADPERLEGDKWRYVILTRLDLEPPPERPPRTKRRNRRNRNETTSGRWGSARWRSNSRKRTQPATASGQLVADHFDGRGGLSAAELMRLMVLKLYQRRPTGRPLPWENGLGFGLMGGREFQLPPSPPSPPQSAIIVTKADRKYFPWISRSAFYRQNGFFRSVDRVGGLSNSLLLL